MKGGDCLTCSNLPTCKQTDPQKILSSYVCELFDPEKESEYLARSKLLQVFGNSAIQIIRKNDTQNDA